MSAIYGAQVDVYPKLEPTRHRRVEQTYFEINVPLVRKESIGMFGVDLIGDRLHSNGTSLMPLKEKKQKYSHVF